MHRRPAPRPVSLALIILAFAAVLAALPSAANAVERMRRFEAVYDIQPDGSIRVTETITWDFGADPHHGIFRNLVTKQACSTEEPVGEPRTYDCPAGSDRHYGIAVASVTDAGGTPQQWEKTSTGDGIQLKIGDPDRTITGEHVYVIKYTLTGALDRYSAHAELYWNASGVWPVTIDATVVTVKL
ncbi:MAG TPA: DUF2207 domain-containing protein, partial [Tepidiformaceae bacterium]|nr:DUF2207 domain-containing protein [Tepidiformaceae bacterium]